MNDVDDNPLVQSQENFKLHCLTFSIVLLTMLNHYHGKNVFFYNTDFFAKVFLHV